MKSYNTPEVDEVGSAAVTVLAKETEVTDSIGGIPSNRWPNMSCLDSDE